MADTRYARFIALCSSTKVAKVYPPRLINSRATAGSSALRPSATRPFPLNSRSSLSIEGSSRTQGPHHVAQKLSSTTWPLRSRKLTVLPSRSVRVKSTASLPVKSALAALTAAGLALSRRLNSTTLRAPFWGVKEKIESDKGPPRSTAGSEEHTPELQSHRDLVC